MAFGAEILVAAAISAAFAAGTHTLNYLLAPKPKPVEKGRLQGDVQIMDSSYGNMILLIYGGQAASVVTADAALETLTASGAHTFTAGQALRLTTTGGLPAPLALGTTYYVRDPTTTTFRLSATTGGAAIDLTNAGTGVHTATETDTAHGIRVGGNVVWMNDIRKVESRQSGSGGNQGGGGKGGGRPSGPDVITISYFVDLAVMLGEGELELLAVYANADKIYDVRVPSRTGIIDPVIPPDEPYDPIILPDPQDGGRFQRPHDRYGYHPVANARGEISVAVAAGGYAGLRFYAGREDQLADPAIAADFQTRYAADYTAGRQVTPAYLGRSYFVIEDFDISKYGSVPTFTAIVRNKNLKTAQQICDDLSERSGLPSSLRDFSALATAKVRGMAIINRRSMKSIVEETLRLRFPFDLTQRGGKVTAIMRGGAPVYDIPIAHLGWRAGGAAEQLDADNTPINKVAAKVRTSQVDLPRVIDLKAFDVAKEFEISAQSAQRQVVATRRAETIELNMSLTTSEMRDVAQRLLDVAHLEGREALTFQLPHNYCDLVPGDVVRVPADDSLVHQVRITEISGAIPGVLEIAGLPTDAALYQQTNPGTPSNYTAPPVPTPATIVGTFIDTAYLRDRDQQAGRAGIYVAASMYENGEFRAARVYRDRGAGYELMADLPERAVLGRAATVLTQGGDTVDISLFGTSSLSSATAAAVDGGTNACLLGGEVFGFTSALPVSGFVNRWRVSGLRNRGARQTSAAQSTHVVNERFVLLDSALRYLPLERGEAGVARNWKFVAAGQAVADASVISFTWSAAGTKLPVPTGLQASINGTRVRVSWNPVAEQDRAQLKHYVLYSDAGLTQELQRGDQTFYEMALQAGVTSYSFWLVAVNQHDQVSAAATTTTSVVTVPDVMGFSAAWDGLDASFTWTEVADAQARLAGYRLYDTANDFIGFTARPPFAFRPTAAATTLRIKAVDAVGNLSPNFVSHTLNIANPVAPTSPNVSYDGGQTLLVYWLAAAAVGVTSYRLRDSAGVLLADRVTEFFWRTKPARGVENYTFRIFAVNRVGLESLSYAEILFTMPRPAAPSSLACVWDGKDLEWSWPQSASAGVDEYELTDSTGATTVWRGAALKVKEQPAYGVQSYTRRIYALRNGLRSTASATLTFSIPVPLPPSSASASFDGLNVLWTLTASPSAGIKHYTGKDTSNNVIADGLGLKFSEIVAAGVATYTRRFFAVNLAGISSTTYAEVTFTVPAPDPPATYTVAHARLELRHAYAPPALLPIALEYELARANDGTNIVGRAPDLYFTERGYAVSSRTLTRYARSLNIAGRTSGWATASVNVEQPAAPTLVKDTARQNPLSLPVHVSTTIERARILATVLQVRAQGAGTWPALSEGTSGTFRLAGAPPTVTVEWAAGGAMEFRIAHEDEFTPGLGDHLWSQVTAHTFPQFNDGAIDPSSNFLRQAGYRAPVITGGGTFQWTVDYKLTWTQALIISGVPDYVSSTRAIQIAANASGTNIGEGQRLVAAHTIGQSTASLQVVALSTYQPPEITSQTFHYPLAERAAGSNVLKLYTGQLLNPDRYLDAATLIPRLSSFDADFQNLLVASANIRELRAAKIIADLTDSRIVFGDEIGSRNFIAAGTDVSETGAVAWTEANDLLGDRAVRYGDSSLEYQNINLGFGTQEFFFEDPTGARFGFYVSHTSNQHFMRDNGVDTYLGDNAPAAIKVAVEAGVYKIYRAGALSGQSARTVRYPLRVGRAGSRALEMGAITLTGRLENVVGEKVRWTNTVGITFDANDDYSKTAGLAAEWGNSGAFSVEPVAAGQDGAIEFVAATADKYIMAGLSAADADQSYLTIQYALYLDNVGNCHVYESGVYRGNFGAYTVNDRFRVARESGVIKYRKNGVLLYTSAIPANGAALFVDTAIATTGGTVKTARLFTAGAVGQGWQGTPDGVVEMGRGARIGGYDFFEVQARATSALDANNQLRGNDYGAPQIHKITMFSLLDFAISNDGADWAAVWLACTTPERGADAYANFDSVGKARVRVLNQFGEQVWDTRPFAYTSGEAGLSSFRHPQPYAYPDLQAIYEITFKNIYGWSKPAYLKAGVWSLSLPALVERANNPAQLSALVSPAYAQVSPCIKLNWKRQPGNRTIRYSFRLAGQTTWNDSVSSAAAAFNSYTIDSPGAESEHAIDRFAANGVYDIYVSDGGLTNVRRIRLPDSAVPATTLSAAARLEAQVNLDTQVLLAWVEPQGSATRTDIYRNSQFLNFVGAGGTSFADNTAVVDTDYEYHVVVQYAGGHSAASEIARVRTKVIANLFDPRQLSYQIINGTRVDWTWALGTAVGTVYFDWKVYGPGNWTTITLAAGTLAYSLTGLVNGETYQARVRVSDQGAQPSEARTVTTTDDPPFYK